ncbi:MAG TPA: phosphoadenylyl-sulfate reductase [Candidatus Dormibacteraeota bacterium]|nr:phosphoadenylyl-sulfate reductase [Candidatus Dormibacteraeota bacterium]
MDVERIAEAVESLAPDETLSAVLTAWQDARICITSSFQAEDITLLHLLRKRLPDVPVLFLDTGYHFSQTYEYRDRLAREWSLNLVNVLPKQTVAEQESALGILHQDDPTRCCQLRKVEPLISALEPFDVWFTGLRREQSPTRKNLKKVELHRLPSGKTLWKVSPLADWSWRDVWAYVSVNGIGYLPLYDDGYLSIGCQPCTALPSDPNNPRSGRWGGTKLECGIHTFSKRDGV